MQSHKDIFLQIIRLGIGNATNVRVPGYVDWIELETIAAHHGLSAILVDGVEKIPEGQRPPKQVLLQWIGETLQGYECRYDLYMRTIAEMAHFYNTHGFKMMVLKGYACSLDWPKPNHRPTGDIDIWQFGKQKEADLLLAKERDIKIDISHHHHTVFDWQDFMVENHYDFNNVYHHKSTADLERIFKKLGNDDSHFVELYGEKVYLPSPNLHALFLLKHSMTDFAAFYVTLRQILDWAFFVKAHTKEINWKWLTMVLEDFHMMEFFNVINAICVEDLGFDVKIFPSCQFSLTLKDKVLEDIMEPKFTREAPKRIIPRLIYMFRRWKGNEWKHHMCYKESMWSAFWSGIRSHLIKPRF